MAKAKITIGTLRITTAAQLQSIQGTLVEQTAEYVTLDVKRRGSKKTDRTLFAAADIKLAFISQDVNETYLSVYGELVEEYAEVTLETIEGGYFSGSMGDSGVLASPGTWQFLPNEVADEETPPATAAKGKGAAATKPAASKPAKAAEPEPEEQEEAPEEEESDDEAYEPAKGDNVTITDEDGDETTGEVELVTAKIIKVGGVKFNRADVTVVQAAAEEADDTPEEQEEYEPEDGHYVAVTDSDGDVVTGTVTGLTAKKITITDDAGEEQAFILSKVTVTQAEAPKPAAKGKGAATKPAAKGAEKPAAGKAKPAESEDW